MKNFFAVALLVAAFLVCGCGSKYSDETYLDERACWAETKENARDLLDALDTDDNDFLTQLFIDGRITPPVGKETKIAVTNEYDGGKIVEIKFLEGRYKNKVGYTLAEFVRDIGKEREQETTEQETTVDGQAYTSLLSNGIKIDNPRVKDEGAGHYSLSAGTNLPNGTRITVAGVETVTKNGNFSVNLAATPSKQILVRVLDEKNQTTAVKSLNAKLIKEKGDAHSIFGKEIYIEIDD